MPKKKVNTSEPIVSSGAAPARTRKHAPAKRTATVETSPSITPTSTTEITASNAEVASSKSVVTFEEISKLAYSYWEARGCQGGNPEEDWLRAEQELTGRLTLSAQA